MWSAIGPTIERIVRLRIDLPQIALVDAAPDQRLDHRDHPVEHLAPIHLGELRESRRPRG